MAIATAAGTVCLLVYLRALTCGFVNWDDQVYVNNNPLIRTMSADFWMRIFTTVPYDFYIPLTQISLAVDYHFWGLDPFGYHLTNIILHATNTGIVVLIADRLLKDRRTSADVAGRQRYQYHLMLLLAALIYGIHPLRVESVAWVTERKDVLNGLFTLGSILAYLRYVKNNETAEEGGKAVRAYIASLVLFLFSLMSKPSSIVLPAMLLVMDWYPLGRFRNGKIWQVLVEKLPYMLFSVVISVITVMKFSEGDTFYSTEYFPVAIRVLVSGNALYEYFKLMIFPVGILPYYHLPLAVPSTYIVKTLAIACFICAGFLWGRKRPWITASLISFIIPLVPTLPFLGNGAHIALAARYTYLPALIPSISLSVLIIAAYQKAAENRQRIGTYVMIVVTVMMLLFYVVMTQKLINVWRDAGTMWSRVIEHQPFDRAYFYRGLFYADSGNPLAAVEDYTSCLQIATEEKLPDIYNLYAFRGEALLQAGRYEDAAKDLTTAIEIFPHRLYFYHRGMALKGMGNTRQASADLKRAGRAKGKMHWFAIGSATE